MMQGVLRSWCCQNEACGVTFEAWINYPECPQCSCARTNWIPGGGHVGGVAPGIDRELRTLADNYGMTNISSAKAGERAMPKLDQPAAHDRGPMMQFGPGFVGVPYERDAAGNARAVCMPSAAKVNFKVKAPIGKPLQHSGSVPGPAAGARIEGSHKA
jgi:hypothetical protein